MATKPRRVLLSLNWYDGRIHLGVQRYAREQGWLLQADAHGPYMPVNVVPDGMIAAIGRVAERRDWLLSRKVPYVLLSANHFGLDAPCVRPDNVGIGRLAAAFYARRGFRHFCGVFPHPHRMKRWAKARLAGFRAGVAEAGGVLHLLRRPIGGDAGEAREDLAKLEWLKAHLRRLPRPLAVFVPADPDGVLLQEACLELEVAIPEQLAVLGVDNDPTVCPHTWVPMSSIDPDWDGVGYAAAAALDGLLAGVAQPPTQVIAPKGVVERKSTAVVAVEDRRVAEAVSLIWESSHLAPSVAEICESVGVARRTLEGLFRIHLGRGIGQEIRRHRVQQVKAMLRDTDLTAAAIAARLRFSTPQYMYNQFRIFTGMTTRDYRAHQTAREAVARSGTAGPAAESGQMA